ncbi:MAG TPA: polyprenol monophosphomannose synthase [Thermoplasmata archaeon]|nr:polyprenol monophosphomannose synthase [Thermoplasmata archaeon]
MDLTVILPTYNERESIVAIRPRLEAALRPYSCEVIVVDDESPDGTGEVVRSMQGNGGWKLVERRGARGLASAVAEGFRQAQGEVVVVMDADGSHPPEVIPALVEPIRARRASFTLASRFVAGGSDTALVGIRRLISWGAALLARPLTPVHDPMSGFFAVRRDVVDHAALHPVGYKIALEVMVRCRPRPLLEVPFAFQARIAGESKLGAKQIAGYVGHLGRLYGWRFASLGRASSTR